MGQLRRRMDRYKRSSRPSPLILSGREASFLLREQLGLPAWLAVEGSELRLEARIGEQGRCWSVGFRGRVELEQRNARIRPSVLTVGRLELGWLVGGRTFELPVDTLASAGGGQEIASHLLTMQVADDSVFLRIDDPAWIR